MSRYNAFPGKNYLQCCMYKRKQNQQKTIPLALPFYKHCVQVVASCTSGKRHQHPKPNHSLVPKQLWFMLRLVLCGFTALCVEFWGFRKQLHATCEPRFDVFKLRKYAGDSWATHPACRVPDLQHSHQRAPKYRLVDSHCKPLSINHDISPVLLKKQNRPKSQSPWGLILMHDSTKGNRNKTLSCVLIKENEGQKTKPVWLLPTEEQIIFP